MFTQPLRRATALLFAGLALAGAMSADAQTDKELARPRLEADADTNNAQSYYQFGLKNIVKRPREAATAFYWASRLAPPWADPYYGRATALILGDRSRLVRYLTGDKAVMRSKQVEEIDSLYSAAYIRNPFVVSRLDFFIYEEFVSQLTNGEAVGLFRGRTGDPAFDAWMAYMQGNHARALRYYATAIKRQPKEIELHVERARSFAALAAPDSALTEMSKALEKMRELKKDRLEHAFESMAMFEYSVAHLHRLGGNDSLARAAYERALISDLSFYAAHAALGDLAVRHGDTATAVQEYAQAVELRPDDGGLQAAYALALIHANRQAEAAQALERAIELEPFFAQPYFLLARLLDHAGFTDEAIARYEAFLQRAALMMTERELAQARVAALRAPAP
jgi:tetratricopeptide (TPR) repeat protein